MTHNAALWQEVTAIVEEMTGLEAESLDAEHSFEELGFDSLTTVEIAVAAEERLGVRIPDEELVELRTIGEAVEAIEALLAGNARALTAARDR
jgi:acyl carrier protein